MKNSQRGFTLIEILAVMAIGGVLLSGLVTAIFQTFAVTKRSSIQVAALTNIESVVYWVSKDMRMADANSANTTVSATPSSNVTLGWTTWYDNTTGQLNPAYYWSNYAISPADNKTLRRTFYNPGTADNGTINTLTDNALTPYKNDYWNGSLLKIVKTTDGLAPQGESQQVTHFSADNFTLYTNNFSAAIGSGDTYELYMITTVARYISDIKFSRASNIVSLTVTSSPEGKPQTAKQESYRFYLQPKEVPIR